MYSKDQDASLNDIRPNDNCQPEDTVSCLKWGFTNNNMFLGASSWDSKIRIYELANSQNGAVLDLKTGFNIEDPALSIEWSNDRTKLFAGSINGSAMAFDLQSGNSMMVAKHDAGVKSVYWLDDMNLLLTMGFDKRLCFWDFRQQNGPAHTLDIGHKIYCSDIAYPGLVLGLSDEQLLFLNLKDLQYYNKNNLDFQDSPLGKTSQLTDISFMMCDQGIGACSHDGRANLSYTEKSNSGRVKLNNILTFKCHKYEGNKNMLFPVHACGFHPNQKYFFYTAGGEGNLFFWDFDAKNKITGLNFKQQPVTKVAVAPNGNCVAYALGYDWSRGIEYYKSVTTKICVHGFNDNELVFQKR